MNVNDPRWASIDAFVEENRDNILRVNLPRESPGRDSS